jgi:hypothetical protein
MHGAARRRFTDAQRAQPPGTNGRANIAIEYFRKLYLIERKIADADSRVAIKYAKAVRCVSWVKA